MSDGMAAKLRERAGRRCGLGTRGINVVGSTGSGADRRGLRGAGGWMAGWRV
jgi:hypothetical protein